MPGNRHTKKASTEALAFWVVGYHPIQWTKFNTLAKLARTKHRGRKLRLRRCRTQDNAGRDYSFLHVVSESFSILRLPRQRLRMSCSEICWH